MQISVLLLFSSSLVQGMAWRPTLKSITEDGDDQENHLPRRKAKIVAHEDEASPPSGKKKSLRPKSKTKACKVNPSIPRRKAKIVAHEDEDDVLS